MTSRAPASDAFELLPHAISLLRPVLGIVLLTGFSGHDSFFVLPLVLLACASDWFDGEVARRVATPTRAGRLVDNLCDFGFLVCAFAFFAEADVWSPPVWGRLVRSYEHANWLPVVGLLASFGVYFLRLLLDMRAGRDPERSPRGHAAGVSNYVLVVAGAVELLPGVQLGPWILEPGMVTVALLNILAVPENVRLLLGRVPPAGPRA